MTDKKTPYGTIHYGGPCGVIHYGGPCKDDYPNIRLYDQGRGRQPIKLQGPAMKAFKAAEERCGRLIPAASWRSCAYQAQLYATDHDRYATPASSLHCRGLAIDVSTDVSWLFSRKIRRALTHEGWKQARSDEPWHWSYFVVG